MLIMYCGGIVSQSSAPEAKKDRETSLVAFDILKWISLFILFLSPNDRYGKGQWNYFNA